MYNRYIVLGTGWKAANKSSMGGWERGISYFLAVLLVDDFSLIFANSRPPIDGLVFMLNNTSILTLKGEHT